MKVSPHFKNEIETYLEQRAEYDELFAHSYRNPLKNIEDCLLWIAIHNKHKTLKVVQSRGVCNSNTEYHDRIIKLVNKNKNLIRQQIAA